MKDFFDRKTFDPINNKNDLTTLNRLRAYGGSRKVESSALLMGLEYCKNRAGRVFIDLGCGDSRDWIIAKEKGFIASRLNIFPPLIDRPDYKPKDFYQTDVVERIPWPDGIVDLAISQAMLDLVEPVAREKFFREVDRVLKSSGVFACYIQWLEPGWGIDVNEEKERAEKVWPGQVKSKGSGFVVIKGDSNE